MSKRDYHKWFYYLERGDVTVNRILVERKGSPKIGDGFQALDGSRWSIWYIEEGPRVRNARLEPLSSP